MQCSKKCGDSAIPTPDQIFIFKNLNSSKHKQEARRVVNHLNRSPRCTHCAQASRHNNVNKHILTPIHKVSPTLPELDRQNKKMAIKKQHLHNDVDLHKLLTACVVGGRGSHLIAQLFRCYVQYLRREHAKIHSITPTKVEFNDIHSILLPCN